MIDYTYYFFKHVKYDKSNFSRFKNEMIAIGELIFRGHTSFTYCHPNPHELEFIELIDGNGFRVKEDNNTYIITIAYN